MTDTYVLLVDITDAALAILAKGKYSVKLGTAPKPDRFDAAITPPPLVPKSIKDRAGNDLVGAIKADTPSPIRIEYSKASAGSVWYWINYSLTDASKALDAREVKPILKKQLYMMPGSQGYAEVVTDPTKVPWLGDSAFGLYNEKPVDLVIYTSLAVANETQPLAPTGDATPTWYGPFMPGYGQIRIKSTTTLGIWFESNDDGEDYISQDQSISNTITYKERDNFSKTVYYWSNGTWSDKAEQKPPAA